MPVRPLLPAPSHLVTGGRFNLGTYGQEIAHLNPLDAAIGGPIPLPRCLKSFRLKEWEHFALVNRDVYISLALFNAKTLALAQVCIYSRKSGAVHFFERKTAAWKVSLPSSLLDSRATYRSKGFELSIHNHLAQGRFEIDFDLEASRTLPAVRGHFTAFEEAPSTQPLVVVLPLGKHTAMYSHKYVCPLEGTLDLDGATVDFRAGESYGLIDIHKGYYPFVMKWHWATGGFYGANGQLSGFNLTDNQVEDQDAYNENCVWVDGVLHLLPPVRFQFDPDNLLDPWSIADQQGMVKLTFKPEVVRTVDVNALVIRNRYRGPFGSFTGTLGTADGGDVAIENAFGMCEDFYLRT